VEPLAAILALGPIMSWFIRSELAKTLGLRGIVQYSTHGSGRVTERSSRVTCDASLWRQWARAKLSFDPSWLLNDDRPIYRRLHTPEDEHER
jgi:hypothetical protein